MYFDICPKRKQGQGPKMEGLSYTGLVFEGFSCLTKQGQGFKPLAHGIYTQTWGKHGSSAPLPPPSLAALLVEKFLVKRIVLFDFPPEESAFPYTD